MQQKSWALFNYALTILLLLLLLFLPEHDARLALLFLLIVLLTSHLLLLRREELWNGTHNLAILFIIFSGLFLLLTLLWRLSILFLIVLIVGSLLLLLLEITVAWRTLSDPFFRVQKSLKRSRREPLEEDWVVESIGPQLEPTLVFTKRGSKTYHTATCRSLQKVKRHDIVELSDQEAKAYNLRSCKICKP